MHKLLFIALASASLTAAADVLNGADPDAILALAKGHGSAELSKDDHGDPLIQGRMSGNKYQIIFYDCENGKNCTTVTFDAAWENNGSADLDTVNNWNQSKRFGRAFLDSDGDPALDWDVNLTAGVNSKNFDDTLNIWNDIMQEYAEFIKQ